MAADSSPYRLPRSVEPLRYELTLTPDLDAATFAGDEQVRVHVHEPVSEIVLNAIELEIHDAELTSDDGTRLDGTITLDEDEQQATISLAGTASPGQWTLHLTFSGILNDKLHGFYRSTFKDEDGVEHVIATTQFEATDARRAFPCWDEPDRKAVFAVTLIVDDALAAISNSEVVEERDLGNGKRSVTFADTMRMSTYLVAFIVGPFEVTDPVDVDGVPLRVVCVPGKRDLASFALDMGAHSLRYFTSYFGLPYPGDKLDLIAIPDFAFGAMENLGAVTFRETALLVDRDNASRIELERVADVVAHEIAHMWFGDLVTMKWWNGIWLNEAFATFMELLCVDAFRPEWKRWVSFGTGRAQAFVVDGLASTRPIEFPVGRPEEAEGMFDVLTYQKGAAVLRMLEQYLGGDEFRRGIAAYIKRHSYDNTETTDLWDALEEETGEPARSTMDSWILQGGYPVISVTRGDDGVTLSQERFRYRGDGPDGTRWQVPLLLRGADGEQERLLLSERSATVPAADWIVVNDGGHGFYRVSYPPEMVGALIAQADLGALERFNLVSDTWATTLAGRAQLRDFVTLIGQLRDEDDPDVWSAMLGPLYLVDRVIGDDARPRFEAFVRDLVGPAFDRLGWTSQPGEDDRTGSLRATLVGALGTLGDDADVHAEAARLHDAYLEDRSAVDPDLVAPVVGILARTGGEAEYTSFLSRHRTPATPQEEVRYLYALAEFRHPSLVRRTLDMALTEVRVQNAPFLIGQVMTNRVGGRAAWTFVKEKWDAIVDRFPSKLLPRMLESMTALVEADIAADVHRFLADHPLTSGEKLVEQAEERLDINVAFREREEPTLAETFGAG